MNNKIELYTGGPAHWSLEATVDNFKSVLAVHGLKMLADEAEAREGVQYEVNNRNTCGIMLKLTFEYVGEVMKPDADKPQHEHLKDEANE